MNEDKRCRPILFHSEGQDTSDQVIFDSIAWNYNISSLIYWFWLPPISCKCQKLRTIGFQIEYGC
jgi:hypothetical protein